MTKVTDYLKKEFERRLIQEGYSRIEKCFSMLTEDQIWHKENANSNSMGNIVLHLCGNVRQYIISGIGDEIDTRERDKEFLLSSRINSKDLTQRISKTVTEANRLVQNMTEEDFLSDFKIQGFDENGTSTVVHVIEHFSYHVGQITYYTKMITDRSTGYYEGLDLNVTS